MQVCVGNCVKKAFFFILSKWGGEKGKKYAQLKAEFQRIERRDFKKAFLSEQCAEIEENSIMKTRDLFKKIGDTKGIFHARLGTIKDKSIRT